MALTGTDRGSGSTNTGSQSTLVVTPASNLSAGSLAVLCVAYDNSGTLGADPFSSISDSSGAGNTWTSRQAPLNDPGAANAGQVLRVFTCRLKAALTTAQSITIDFGGVTTVARSWTLMEITAAAGKGAVYQTGGNTTGSSTGPTITSGSITNGDMIIGAMGAEGNAAITGDADTSNGSWSTQQTSGVGTTNAASEISSQRKVVTGTATQTYNLTITSADWCIAWIQLREVDDTTVTPGVIALATTAFAPSARTPITVTPGTKALTSSSFAPKAQKGTIIVPAKLSQSLTSFATTLLLNVIVPVRSLTGTTFAPVLAEKITLSTRAVTVTSYAAHLGLGVVPQTASLLNTEFAPRLAFAVEPITLTMALTGLSPTVIVPGFFPTTPILDDFNRADEGPPPSANWTTGIAFGFDGFQEPGFAVSGNQLFNIGNDVAQQYWSAEQFGPDCEAHLTLADSSDLRDLSLCARLNNIGEFTTGGYAALVFFSATNGGTNNYTIYKIVNGGLIALVNRLEAVANTPVAGHKYAIQIVANTILFWADTGGGWEVKLSITDSTYLSAGFIGMTTESNINSRQDEFGGGNTVLPLDRTLIPAAAALNLSTPSPVIQVGLQLIPTTQSLTITAAPPRLIARVISGVQNLTISGLAPTLAGTVAPPSPSLNLTTYAPTAVVEQHNLTVTPDTKALSVSLFSPNLKITAVPSTRTLALTTVVPAVVVSENVTVVTATRSLFISTLPPFLNETVTPPAKNASLAVFTPTPAVTANFTLVPSAAALMASPFAVVLHLSVITAANATTLGSFRPSVTTPVDVHAATRSLSVITFEVSLRQTNTPVARSLNTSLFAPTVNASNNLTITPAAKNISVTSTRVTLALSIAPDAQSLTLTRFAPELTANVSVAPSSGSLTLTRFTPRLAETVTVSKASLNLSTLAPTIAIRRVVVPSIATFVITKYGPSLAVSVTPAKRTLTTTAFGLSLTFGAQPNTATLSTEGSSPSLASRLTGQAGHLSLVTFEPNVQGLTVLISPSASDLALIIYGPDVVAFAPAFSTRIAAENHKLQIADEDHAQLIAREASRAGVPRESRTKYV